MDDHFATLKLDPPKTILVVLHTGVKVKAQPALFKIANPEHLLQGAATNRSVPTLNSNDRAVQAEAAIEALLRQRISQM
jgi:hypothetical protein